MEELREEEGLTSEGMNELTNEGGSHAWCGDSQLETDIAVCFPTDYIENVSERITLYRELDGIRSEEQMLDFKKKLIDRFGVLPEPAEE